MRKNKEKDGRTTKGKLKEDKRVEVNKPHGNDNKLAGDEKAGKQDEASKNFPNFCLLNEEERQVFFEALSTARRNLEKKGVATRQLFGTVHDGYLNHFKTEKENDSEKPASREPDSVLEERVSSSGDGSATFILRGGDSPQKNIPSDNLKRVSTFCVRSSFLERAKPEVVEQCESVILQNTNRVIDLYVKKKKKREKSEIRTPEKNRGEKEKRERESEKEKENEAKENVRKLLVGKPLKNKNTPRFDALSPEEKRVFFKILDEARVNVVKNPGKKNEVLALDSIAKMYQGYRRTTNVFAVSPKPQNQEEEKNLHVKVTLTSGDIKKMSKSEKVEEKKVKEKNVDDKAEKVEGKKMKEKNVDDKAEKVEEKLKKKVHMKAPNEEKVEKNAEEKTEKEDKKTEDKTGKVDKKAEKTEKENKKTEENTEKENKKTEEKTEKVDKKAEKTEKENKKTEENTEKVDKEVEEKPEKENKKTKDKTGKVDKKAEKTEKENKKTEEKTEKENKKTEEKTEKVDKEVEKTEKENKKTEEKTEKVDKKAEKTEKENKKTEEKPEKVDKEVEKTEKENKQTEEKPEKENKKIEEKTQKENKKTEEKPEKENKKTEEKTEKENKKIEEKTEKVDKEVEEKTKKVEEKKSEEKTKLEPNPNVEDENLKADCLKEEDKLTTESDVKECCDSSEEAEGEASKNLKAEKELVKAKEEVKAPQEEKENKEECGHPQESEKKVSDGGEKSKEDEMKKSSQSENDLEKANNCVFQVAKEKRQGPQENSSTLVCPQGATEHAEEPSSSKCYRGSEKDDPQALEERREKATSSLPKVMFVEDNVIDKIRDLICYLELKARKDDRLEKEYIKLLVDYVDYLSRVMEALVDKKNSREAPFKMKNSYIDAEVHLKFNDDPEAQKSEKESPHFGPRSVSEHKLGDIVNLSKEKAAGKGIDAGRESQTEMKMTLSQTSVASANSDEKLFLPLLSERKEVGLTKIRLLQDLLKKRAEFVEGEDLKIVHHPVEDFVPVERPESMKAVTIEREEKAHESNPAKLFRRLIKFFNCRKKQEEEYGVFENLKGEAVRVVEFDEKNRDPANATLNQSVMEVLKAAKRKKVIEKFYGKG